MHWRYGEQLRWTLVTIGLTEDAGQYAERGYTTTRSAIGYARFRRFGMPFQITPKARLSATSPACRAIVATRLAAPELEDSALRALQLAQFTTTATIDDPDTLRAALAGVDGLDAGAVVDHLDDPEIVAAYEADRARARTAEGSPTEFQGRAADTDGAVRYTAPSLVFRGEDGGILEAGGFQPIEAYDVVIANLDPTLERQPPAEDPVEVLAPFPYALTTAEGGRGDDRAPGRPRRGRRGGRAHHRGGRGTSHAPARGRRLALGAGGLSILGAHLIERRQLACRVRRR